MMPHRGRQIVLIIPPHCDFISLRSKGCRRTFDVSLAAVYDMAVRQHVAAEKAAKKARKSK
jgi:hypothetical protein